MNRHERLAGLLELVIERESVHIDDLVRELGVSAATVRRDLDELAEQQLITRTRGGATTAPGSSDLPLRYKTARYPEEKTRIAREAASIVDPGQVVGLNGGTTTTEVAREIAVRPELRSHTPGDEVVVVTNAVNIANELTVRPHLRVVVTGGVARALSYELTGPLAAPILEQITLDVLFLGVDAIDVERGAAAHHEGEAAVNGVFVTRANRVVVVADSAKLGRTAFATICGIEAVDTLITDTNADRGVVKEFRRSGVEVVRV
ncbi:DeoR/GlpR family DNA-binding transcription regulator [Saccharomonospora sp.]|uniref:DeoR/GlpR family DNA-binding transcription regulator n=1 Tax=Saccharomonospora sp. TaxID=33913 RepID=UPI002613EA0E|nr:DeoR/GlpR family DNA-binding transcription regulator [Saccharomonospora sp.]